MKDSVQHLFHKSILTELQSLFKSVLKFAKMTLAPVALWRSRVPRRSSDIVFYIVATCLVLLDAYLLIGYYRPILMHQA